MVIIRGVKDFSLALAFRLEMTFDHANTTRKRRLK